MADHPISDAALRGMAEDAFDVLNWARRMGLKKEQQIEHLASAFRKRMAEAPDPTEKGSS